MTAVQVQMPSVEVLEMGLRVVGTLSASEWEQIGHWLAREHQGHQWRIGDWWNANRDNIPDNHLITLLEQLELDIKTLRNLGSICAAYPIEDRIPGLSLTHHRIAVSLPPAERRAVLMAAKENGWSTRELERRVRERKKELAKELAEDEPLVLPLTSRPNPDPVPTPAPEPVIPRPAPRPVRLPEPEPEPDPIWVEPDATGLRIGHTAYPLAQVAIRDNRIVIWDPHWRMDAGGARAMAQVLAVAADILEGVR
uniref:Uncharacterized protein n=1 Tax=Thermus caliditerrae TaxID=1330700 RepID=A0A7C5REJ8_9DEIN